MEDVENTGRRWLTTRQAHILLSVDVRSVYGLIDEGRLPAYKRDGELLLDQSDVDAYRDSPHREVDC